MNFFSNSIVYFIKKPLIPIYIASISLIYCIISIFNPLEMLSKYYSSFISDDLGDTIVLLSKTVYSYSNIPYILLAVVGISMILSMLSSLIFSGYMNIIHLTVKRIKSDVKQYFAGLKKGFLRVAICFFQIYVCLFLVLAFAPLAFTPYIILRNSVIESGNSTLIPSLLLSVAILAIVLLLIFIYMNFIFRLPSIYHFTKYPIEKATAAVNAKYWRTFVKSAVLLLLYVCVELIMYRIENRVLDFIVGFILYTVYFSFFSVFPFYIYDKLIEPYKLGD